MARSPRWLRSLVAEGDLDKIARAIAEAEAGTSGEIRVHLDRRCPGDPVARAVTLFEHLGMHETAARNGVLVYVAAADRKLAVIGDRGIHERVGQGYWERLVASLASRLHHGGVGEGVVAAVAEVGGALAEHFPRQPDDRNELPDRVSIG